MCVAEFIRQQHFTGRLVFITDGQVRERQGGFDLVHRLHVALLLQVDTGSVSACDDVLRARVFSFVEAHLVDTGGVVNMSCTCPFTRACAHEVSCEAKFCSLSGWLIAARTGVASRPR